MQRARGERAGGEGAHANGRRGGRLHSDGVEPEPIKCIQKHPCQITQQPQREAAGKNKRTTTERKQLTRLSALAASSSVW